MSALSRHSEVHESAAIATSVADSLEIPYGDYAGGIVHVPTGSTITTLTWYVAPKVGGTYRAAQDADGNAVTQTVEANKSYPIPDALYGARAIKATGNAAGSVDVSLKG